MAWVYLFPGQGSQFAGMGKSLVEQFPAAQTYLDRANDIAGFDLKGILCEGSEEDLKQTKATQPAVFLYSVAAALSVPELNMAAAAGHSLGEISALTAAGVLDFESGLRLVVERALAMQEACELVPSGMAAVMGYESETQVEQCCAGITEEVVVPANYNAPGQLVISGSIRGIELVSVKLKEAGVKRVIPLKVGGAFHSPLMEPARLRLEAAIRNTQFKPPVCPVYQNVDGKASVDPEEIQIKLIRQLTAPVQWTQTILNMHRDLSTDFIETGPGKVLSGLVQKISPSATVRNLTV